jgi:hypothetical protein
MKIFEMKHRVKIYITMSIVVSFVLMCVNNYASADDAQMENDIIKEEIIINLVNAERMKEGQNELEENEMLNVVAQKKLQDMLLNNYFAHTSPEGENSWRWFNDVGYDFAYAGENLAIDYDDVYEQHEDWMQSPKHRKNILNEQFTQTGVAIEQVKKDGKDIMITVQVFATPQKNILNATNFTPDTFEVPEPLFYGENDIKDMTKNVYNSNRFLFTSGSNVREIAWGFVIVITIFVAITEYRIFTKRNRKDKDK